MTKGIIIHHVIPVKELEGELLKYLVYYNRERPHQDISGKKTY